MEATAERSPSITLLIVEDDRDALEMLSFVVRKKFPFLTVHTATNGKEGIEEFSRHPAAIVTTDINMPEMGGVQMAAKLLARAPGTKIIVITADTGKAALESALQDGFRVDHYLLKPLDYRKFFSAIEQCLAEITAAEAPPAGPKRP